MGFYTFYCPECGTPTVLHGSDLDKRCDSCRVDRPKSDKQLLREYREHCNRISFRLMDQTGEGKRFRTDVEF